MVVRRLDRRWIGKRQPGAERPRYQYPDRHQHLHRNDRRQCRHAGSRRLDRQFIGRHRQFRRHLDRARNDRSADHDDDHVRRQFRTGHAGFAWNLDDGFRQSRFSDGCQLHRSTQPDDLDLRQCHRHRGAWRRQCPGGIPAGLLRRETAIYDPAIGGARRHDLRTAGHRQFTELQRQSELLGQ